MKEQHRELIDALDEKMMKKFGRGLPEDCTYRSGIKKYATIVSMALDSGRYPCEDEEFIMGHRCDTCKYRNVSIDP